MAIHLQVRTAVTSQTVSEGPITYTVAGALAVGNDAYGRAWASVSPGAKCEVTAITPAQGLDTGNVINGAMKNPVRETSPGPLQGWDQRMAGYSASATLALPALLGANDIVIKTVAAASVDRTGSFSAQSALHVLAATPTGEFLLPSPVGWAGRTSYAPYPIDTDAWLAARTSYAGGSWPSYADIEGCLACASPSMAFRWGATGNAGYEGFSTRGLAQPYVDGSSLNYGRNIGRFISMAMLAMLSQNYTTEQARRICISIARFGLDWGESALRGNAFYVPDGGHYQWAGFPLVHALNLIGDSAQIADVIERVGGNLRQAYLVTPALKSSYFSSHSDMKWPCLWRVRTLGTQPGGATVTIPCSGSGLSQGDNDAVTVPVGALVTRVSDGLTASVATVTPLAQAGTVDIPLTAASPFVSGDQVYIDVPDAWKTDGVGDWALRGYTGVADNLMNFSRNTSYRSLQSAGGQMQAICAMGLYHPTMEAYRRYMERAQAANTPSASNDYETINLPWLGFAVTDFWYSTHYVPI